MVQKAKEYRKTLHTLKAEVLVINKCGSQQSRKMPMPINLQLSAKLSKKS